MLLAPAALALLLGQPVPSVAAAAPSWHARYAAARAEMTAGHFAQAARLFTLLAADAPEDGARTLALEQQEICARWASQGVALVPRAPDENVVAGRRTSNELASLYITSVFYGIGTGVWLSTHTDPRSQAGFVLPALGFAAAASGIDAALDYAGVLGYGVPQSIVAGLSIGLGEGVTWTMWNQAHVRYDKEWHEETVANVIWGATTVGGVAGGVLGALYGTTPGRAAYVHSAAGWTAFASGFFAAALSSEDPTRNDHGYLAAALALNVGAAAAALTAPRVAPSTARVRFLDLGAVAGGLLCGGIYVAAKDLRRLPAYWSNPGDRGFFAVTAAGVVAGLGSAWYLTRHMPQDRAPSERAASPSPGSTLVLVPVAGGVGLFLAGGL